MKKLLDELKEIGAARYHHRHPFHLMMHEGKLNHIQMQAWALNRYYYQRNIPIKDAIILSRSEDPAFRIAWRKRVLDHDGDGVRPGGIEKWVQLAEATGLCRHQVESCEGILPAVKFAVDAYLNWVSNQTFLEAVASSLTELFSRDLISLRMDRLRELYPGMASGLTYFEDRLTQAPEDVKVALTYIEKHATTDQDRESVKRALLVKCDILWAQLDAIYYAYVQPGFVPPGAFNGSKIVTESRLT